MVWVSRQTVTQAKVTPVPTDSSDGFALDRNQRLTAVAIVASAAKPCDEQDKRKAGSDQRYNHHWAWTVDGSSRSQAGDKHRGEAQIGDEIELSLE
jgi:hypothetical protein